jgi:hypothetical protein
LGFVVQPAFPGRSTGPYVAPTRGAEEINAYCTQIDRVVNFLTRVDLRKAVLFDHLHCPGSNPSAPSYPVFACVREFA